MDGQAAMKNFKYLIGGQWIDASGGESFEVLNPLDDTHYAKAAKGTPKDVQAAVAAISTSRATLTLVCAT